MTDVAYFPEAGLPLADARIAIDAARGKSFVNRFAVNVFFGEKEAVAWITVKESKQHGHHIYSVEAIKLETLDRIVEVVSGNTPHASSVPLRQMIAKTDGSVNGGVA